MKVILITGSTDGIGKLAAHQIINEGHHVIIHGRSKAKVDRTVVDLKAANPDSQVSGVVADLSNLNELNNIVEHIQSLNTILDVIINNAGVFNSQVSKTDEGIDLRFMVNYIAPYHLTQLLLPFMNESADKRIINLSSAAQEAVAGSALQGTTTLSERSAYAQSKLALTMWSFQLGQQLKDFTLIPVNPGSLLNTKMVQKAFGRHWSSADKGASILKKLSLEDQYKGISGQYFDNDLGDPMGDFGRAHQDAYDDKKCEKLIELTEQIIDKLSQ